MGFFAGANFIGNSDDAKYKYLEKSGAQIQAKFLYVSLTPIPTQYGQRNTSPFSLPYLANFQIACEGIDPTNQTKKIYFSDNLTSRPDLKITPNTTFKVFVDKNDSSVYWVDLSDVNFDNNFPPVSMSLMQKTPYYRSYDGVNYQKI